MIRTSTFLFAFLLLLSCAVDVQAQTSRLERRPRSKLAPFNKGQLDGRRAADRWRPAWLIGGFAGGITGVVGAGLAYGYAQKKRTHRPPDDVLNWLEEQRDDYQMGYESGYSYSTRESRKQSALIGGLSGVTVLTAYLLLR